MAPTHPENLVSYRTAFAERGSALKALERLDLESADDGPVSVRNDLAARRRALGWQVRLERADRDYDAQRYEEALAGYEAVAADVLALIRPKVSLVKRPKRWLEGEAVTDALVDAGAGLLNHLLPDPMEPPFVLVAKPAAIDPEKLNGEAVAAVAFQSGLPPKAKPFVEGAAAAVQQGRWKHAAQLYERALGVLPETEHQARAEVFLNLGALQVQQGNAREALEPLQQAQTLFGKTGDQLGAAEAVHNSALALLRAGDGVQARETLEKARALAGQASLRGLLEKALTNGAPLGQRSVLLRVKPRPEDAESVAASLGSEDLALRLRALERGVDAPAVKLETPAQARTEAFTRTMLVPTGGQPVKLEWSEATPLTGATLKAALRRRVDAAALELAGFRDREAAAIALALPHLYHVALPIKMADCLHHLQQFERAHEEYARAGRYEMINLALEAPDLWRRMAENVALWGDSLYREGRTTEAVPVYELLLEPDTTPSASLFYTVASLAPTASKVTAWLSALRDGNALPELNPAIAHVLQTVRKRWIYINAGLDFFGTPTNVVAPFSFRHLQEVARYLAQRASQAEQRYIDFYTRYESGQMTRRELDNAFAQAQLGVDLARFNERAAADNARSAAAATTLADLRHKNAQDQLAEFNNAAWELESLAGHIARGNAWTGDDLPNLHYSADGRYDFEGKKHEVLQKLSRRQTAIGNNLQRSRMVDAIAELNQARAIASAQQAAARARLAGAQVESQIARARATHADQMRDAFNAQRFNPEQWLAMAGLMRWLATSTLDQATEVARLMERAYNFENFDDRRVIRGSYRVTAAGDLLGADVLLADVDSFTHYHVTQVREKPIPVKWALSLAEEYPGQFLALRRSGRLDVEVDLARLKLSHPGTYRHRLVAAELEVDGFVPPNGLSGRLTNSGLGRYRAADGSVKLRLQPAETLVLSRYSRRGDALLLSPPTDMRGLFEGNSVMSGWTLELPRASNDVDLRLLFDIRLVLYFDCLYDPALFVADSQPPAGTTFERSRAFHLLQHFPDAYYALRESGSAVIEVAAGDFPFNQSGAVLRSLALGVVPTAGKTLAGVGLTVRHPGAAAPVSVTITPQNTVPAASLPVSGTPAATGRYRIDLAAAQRARKDDLEDLVLVLDYRHAPA